jgi:hypothetical protein
MVVVVQDQQVLAVAVVQAVVDNMAVAVVVQELAEKEIMDKLVEPVPLVVVAVVLVKLAALMVMLEVVMVRHHLFQAVL